MIFCRGRGGGLGSSSSPAVQGCVTSLIYVCFCPRDLGLEKLTALWIMWLSRGLGVKGQKTDLELWVLSLATDTILIIGMVFMATILDLSSLVTVAMSASAHLDCVRAR